MCLPVRAVGDTEDSGKPVSLQEGLLCPGVCLSEALPPASEESLEIVKGTARDLRDFGACLSVSVLTALNPAEPFHNPGIQREIVFVVVLLFWVKTTKKDRNNHFPHRLAYENTRLHSCPHFCCLHRHVVSALGVETSDVKVASEDVLPADCSSNSALVWLHQNIFVLWTEVMNEQTSWSPYSPWASAEAFPQAGLSAPSDTARHSLRGPDAAKSCEFKTGWVSHIATWFTKPLRYWVSLVNHFNYFTKQVVEIDQ